MPLYIFTEFQQQNEYCKIFKTNHKVTSNWLLYSSVECPKMLNIMLIMSCEMLCLNMSKFFFKYK